MSFNLIIFLTKTTTYRNYAFSKILFMYRDINKQKCVHSCFSRVFLQFLSQFLIFLNTVLALIATEYNVYSIEAKIGQNGRRSKCATFY